jgi:hypothetical protein
MLTVTMMNLLIDIAYLAHDLVMAEVALTSYQIPLPNSQVGMVEVAVAS